MKSPPSTPPDEELMLAYTAGDEKSFLLLFQRYKIRLFNYFLRHTGDRAAAEDLFQTTFLKIHRVRNSYRPSAALATWIFTIATNLLRDYKLSARRHFNVVSFEEKRDKVASGGSLSEVMIVSSDKTPELTYGEKEIANLIHQAIQSLPPDQREVILLTKYEGFKYEEIAEILNITVSAAKVRGHRAMKALEKLLKERISKALF